MNQEKMVMGGPPMEDKKSRKGLWIILGCIVVLLIIGFIFSKSLFGPPDTQLAINTPDTPMEKKSPAPTIIPPVTIQQSEQKESPEQVIPKTENEPFSSVDKTAPPVVKEPAISEEELPMDRPTEEFQTAKIDEKTYLPPPEKEKENYYTVQEGDCLWSIAQKEDIFGDPFKWNLIYSANKSQIEDPEIIHPGQKLIIPIHIKEGA